MLRGSATRSGRTPDRELDRRRLLQTALLLAGVSAAGAGCGDLARTAHDAGRFFDRKAYATLNAVADVILPRTDTPGAVDVGVPGQLDAMMTSWASRQTRVRIVQILEEIDAAAVKTFRRPIAKLKPEQQLSVMEAYDAASARDPGYLKFKGLILGLYYMSEPGATQELRYEQVPGVWEPSIKVTSDTRAWAVDSF